MPRPICEPLCAVGARHCLALAPGAVGVAALRPYGVAALRPPIREPLPRSHDVPDRRGDRCGRPCVYAATTEGKGGAVPRPCATPPADVAPLEIYIVKDLVVCRFLLKFE